MQRGGGPGLYALTPWSAGVAIGKEDLNQSPWSRDSLEAILGIGIVLARGITRTSRRDVVMHDGLLRNPTVFEVTPSL
jgi:hypothetical protein